MLLLTLLLPPKGGVDVLIDDQPRSAGFFCMKEQQPSFLEQRKAAGDRNDLLKSNVFTPITRQSLRDNDRMKVVVMVEMRKNDPVEDLKNLLKTLESAQKEEHIIFEANHKYSTVDLDASSDLIAFLPKVRPEIVEIYPVQDAQENTSNTTQKSYMDTYKPSSVPHMWV